MIYAIIALSRKMATLFKFSLSQFTERVRSFGFSSLPARINSRRREGIGDVLRMVDGMANYIEIMLASQELVLRDISHELRPPLTRLWFAAELARTSHDSEAAARRVATEVERLVDLIGKIIPVPEPVGEPRKCNLENLLLDVQVRELVQDCEIEAIGRGCQFTLSGSNHLELRASRELLRDALRNIFRNAIRCARSGSYIEVVMNRTARIASVSVRDFGSGVPSEALTKIFEPFFRVDDARNPLTGGAGLGLAIAKGVIRMHGGHIWAENARPGLKVTIELPLSSSALSPEPPENDYRLYG